MTAYGPRDKYQEIVLAQRRWGSIADRVIPLRPHVEPATMLGKSQEKSGR